jgi:serine/threonine protein kinase
VSKLHDVGICHRDIKPENILINENYKVKVIDFGSASHFGRLGNCQAYLALGQYTVPYAAPELLKGDVVHGVPQDIWALGVVLYTLVYGILPFNSPMDTLGMDAKLDVEGDPGILLMFAYIN